jgi:hypothetical protein
MYLVTFLLKDGLEAIQSLHILAKAKIYSDARK